MRCFPRHWYRHALRPLLISARSHTPVPFHFASHHHHLSHSALPSRPFALHCGTAAPCCTAVSPTDTNTMHITPEEYSKLPASVQYVSFTPPAIVPSLMSETERSTFRQWSDYESCSRLHQSSAASSRHRHAVSRRSTRPDPRHRTPFVRPPFVNVHHESHQSHPLWKT